MADEFLPRVIHTHMPANDQTMSDIHEVVAKAILSDLHSLDPDIRHKAISEAIRFLKDNGIESLRGTNKTINKISSSLPFSDDEDDGHIPFPKAK